jgi:hypothetical protein
VTTIVAINNSDKEKTISLNYKVPKKIVLQDVSLKSIISDKEKVTVESDKVIFKLSPKSAIVYGIMP